MSINKISWLMILFLSSIVFTPAIISAQIETAPLNDINPDKIGETLSVKGRIVSIIPPRSDTAPYSLYLTNDTDTLVVVLWEKVWNRIPFRNQLKPDAQVIITGTLKEYRNNLNFYLTEPDNIVLLGADLSHADIRKSSSGAAKPTPDLPPGVLLPSRIDRSQMGQNVVIQGMVREYRTARSETAPHSVFLDDGSGSLRVVYWSKVANALGSGAAPKPGRILRIGGTVDEYRGELQLRVNNARDIIPVNVEKSGEHRKSSASVPLGSIVESHKGQQITVTGRIIDLNPSQNARDPNKATLMDGSGALIVLYNQDVAETLKDNSKLELGKNYEMKGQIIEEKGQLRLKILDPSNIRIAGDRTGSPSPDSPTASPGKSSELQGTKENPLHLPINSITADHLGLYVKTKGKVVNLTPSLQETAPNVATLSSGNATVNMVYWNDVADIIPAEKKPEINKVLRITGKVREFRDDLQIKIYTPDDIIVLPEAEVSSSDDSVTKKTPTVDQSPAQEKGTASDPLILPISELTGELEDKWVIIKGKVTDIKTSWQASAPTKVTLSDDKGKIVIVYWADVADRLTEAQKPKTGQTIQLKGKVATYRDELQVKISEPGDLVIIDKNL